MAAIALDLSPLVTTLVERPFDRAALDAASAAVNGHPQAYATALRCAAKRAEDKLAAAYFLTEAARVHESVDDIGGAIALLFRARECDPDHPGTRESLASCLTRLALRSGLSFTFTAAAPAPAAKADESEAPNGVTESLRPVPRESGLRPPSLDRPRDTLPDLFGLDGEGTARLSPDTTIEWADYAEDAAPSAQPAPIEPVSEPPPRTLDSTPAVFPLQSARRVEPLLPPSDPEFNVATLVPSRKSEEPVLRAVADLALPTRRSSDLPPSTDARPSISPPPPIRSDRVAPSFAERRAELRALPEPPESATPLVGRIDNPLPSVTDNPLPSMTDVYGEEHAPKTERPAGDRLVGALFEALHGLHFLDDVRSGAEFVAKVLHDAMRASTVLVHVYDINSRHFVVMSAIGARATALADYATPEDDPFLTEIVKEEEAVLVLDPKDDPRLSRGRFLLVEPQRSLVCAASVIEGRYLGLLEVVDPIDGSEFNEDDRNALTYTADAFSRFLDRRGIVLSEEDETPELQSSATA